LHQSSAEPGGDASPEDHGFYLEEIDHRVLSGPETEIAQCGGAILSAMLGDVVATCALIPEDARGRGRVRIDQDGGGGIAPALRLYESAGFERQPSIKPDAHDACADVYMVWRKPTRASG
jgi:hypothetical protein